MYGKYHLPTMGIQLVITDGKYRKSSFSKEIMNKTATSLIREMIEKNTCLIEPMMLFSLDGE